MILLDTSVLIESLTGARRALPGLRRVLAEGERLLVPSLVLYEWLRGPRTEEEIRDQERLFSRDSAVPFGIREAALAATLYRSVPRARGRELDLAIASCAITHEAALWTLNTRDFEDIPGLVLVRESSR